MSCAPRAKKALEKLDGVQQVEVDFKSKKATVAMKEGKTLTKKQVEDALEEEGFEVGSFEEKSAKSSDSEDGHSHESTEGNDSGVSCWKCEQGHIQGHKGKKGECAQCGKALQKTECPEDSAFEDLKNETCPLMDDEVVEGAWIIYDGKKIHFCCEGCDKDFMEDPEKYLKQMKEGKKDSGNKESDKNKNDKHEHKHHHKH